MVQYGFGEPLGCVCDTCGAWTSIMLLRQAGPSRRRGGGALFFSKDAIEGAVG